MNALRIKNTSKSDLSFFITARITFTCNCSLYRPFLFSDVPTNEEKSKNVTTKSFMSLACWAETAELVSGSTNENVEAILSNVLPQMSDSLRSGYFAVSREPNASSQLIKICFEPGILPTVNDLDQLYPTASLRFAKGLPFFQLPQNDEHIKGVLITLSPDRFFYSGGPSKRSCDRL